MSRLPTGRSRAVTVLAVISVIVGLWPALGRAQTPTPEPVIDSAPRLVGFSTKATIRGHLEDGTPGDEVLLQRRRGERDWNTVAERTVSSDEHFKFRRRDMRKSTFYRLVWKDEATGVRTKSDTARVEVRPRLTFRVKPRHVYRGRRVRIAGHLLPTLRERRKVTVEQRVHGRWNAVKRLAVRGGDFSGRIHARHRGHRKLRLVFGGDKISARAKNTKPYTIYEPDPATWYGPGFYGNRTACGQTLTTGTLGVAHRTLPCGTSVSLLYRGRTVTVRVIDRGPYSSADWDLTRRTAERLRFSGKDDVGVTR
ncbi:MAG: septal ring lytic transglycosylase RlpA family protein [Actinomycetota bacterium]